MAMVERLAEVESVPILSVKIWTMNNTARPPRPAHWGRGMRSGIPP